MSTRKCEGFTWEMLDWPGVENYYYAACRTLASCLAAR